MPHCVLEYTEKSVDKDVFYKFFNELHNFLVETKEFKLEAIKSRVVYLDCFHMGNGNANNQFFYLNIAILKGRNEDFRKSISNSILELMKKYFNKTDKTKGFSLAVNISELDKNTYSRYYEEN